MALQSKLGIIATIVFATCIISCGPSVPPETHRILVIYDVTGSQDGVLPTAAQIMTDIRKLVPIGEVPNDGIYIATAMVDDISGAPIVEHTLPAELGSAATTNPKKRSREVKTFASEVEAALEQQLAAATTDKQSSKIYSKLCRTLRNFHASGSPSYLLLYSDLLENSTLASFYKPDQLQSASSDPLAYYRDNMKPSCSLPDLQGLTCSIYPYRTQAQDNIVTAAEQFWVGVLEGSGAVVAVDR